MSSLREAKPPKPQRSDIDQVTGAPPVEASSVTLGPRDRLIGQLYIEGDLRVNGTLEGEVRATGNVDVSEAGNVKATVAGREVNISGHVNGAVTASKKLVVASGGSLIGDVRVPRLVIQDGASFSGNVSMGAAAEATPKAAPAVAAHAAVVAPEAVPAAAAAPEPAPLAIPAPAAKRSAPAAEKPKPKRR